MSTLGPYFFPAFLLLVLAWVCLSAFVILSRALYDRRHGAVRDTQRRLRASIVVSSEGHMLVPDSLLAQLPESVVEEIAADSLTPKWQAETLASYVLRQRGKQELIQRASTHHGPGGKRSRIAALRILALAGEPGVIPLLDQAVHDKDPDIVGAAVAVLGGINEESAAHILIDVLRSRPYSPSRVATQLDRFSEPISHLLLPLLRHPIPVVRFWGATLMSRYASPEINAELALLGHDPDPGVRKAAVETLGKIGGPHSTETAVALIEDPVWFVRAHAARALGDLQRVDLCDLVTPLLADLEWWVRTAAKDSLEAMGPDVAGPLIEVLSSPDPFARNGAAEVLQNLGILDALITESIQTDYEHSERVELIGKILAAGGPDLIRIAVARADPAIAAAALRLIQKVADRYRLAG
jgi:HEAT repeat protein